MNNKAYTILSIILVVALFSGCAGVSDISYKIVEKSGYFTVGYDPECFHTYDGYGLAINIIKQAAQRMGVEAPIRPVNDYDWLTYLKNEDIDVMLCKTSDEALNTNAVFDDSIVLVSNDFEAAQKVGVIDSSDCIEQKNILSYEKDYDFVYYSDGALLLNDLSSGIVDAALMSEYDALSYSGISAYDLKVLSQSPVYFVVSNQKQTFYDKLNAALIQMANDGTIARLKQEYISSID